MVELASIRSSVNLFSKIAMLAIIAISIQSPVHAGALEIQWRPETVRLIERDGDYARMARLSDGAIACAYDYDGKMCLRRSTDDGLTWGQRIQVAEEPDCWLTNAYLLPLANRDLLYFWNERPRAALRFQRRPAPRGLLTRPFLIRMARSSDWGVTWSSPTTLYEAGPTYQDGCWEPAAIQLTDGEVQVYFSNERPYPDTDEQEISLLRSKDGGRTWSKAERVAMRARHRDGMPAPLALAGGHGILVAIEDNGLSSGSFKPAIVSTTADDNWSSGPVGGDSNKRWGALAMPLEPDWYGGAPFLAQLPSGETLLSYQESSDGSLRTCQMAVCVGDASGRRFGRKTYPLPSPAPPGQLWNSLFVKNADTVTAILGGTVNGVRGVWAIDGDVHAASSDKK
jgi:hypothetical protein